MEPSSLHENKPEHATRRLVVARILPSLGQLLCEIHRGLRSRRAPSLGGDHPKRTHGNAALGIVHLHRRAGTRFLEKQPRPHNGSRWIRRQENRRLGPQPRPYYPPRQYHFRRSRRREVRLGNRLSLVRNLDRRQPQVREPQAHQRGLPRQAALVHGRVPRRV